MIQLKVIECSFFVPIRRDINLSDGELHSTELWEWLDDELRTLLSVACVKFQQKCIYLSTAGQVEFIEANQNETS